MKNPYSSQHVYKFEVKKKLFRKIIVANDQKLPKWQVLKNKNRSCIVPAILPIIRDP